MIHDNSEVIKFMEHGNIMNSIAMSEQGPHMTQLLSSLNRHRQLGVNHAIYMIPNDKFSTQHLRVNVVMLNNDLHNPTELCAQPVHQTLRCNQYCYLSSAVLSHWLSRCKASLDSHALIA